MQFSVSLTELHVVAAAAAAAPFQTGAQAGFFTLLRSNRWTGLTRDGNEDNV